MGSYSGGGMAVRLRQICFLFCHADPLTFPWHSLRYQHVQAVRTKLIEPEKAPVTVNVTLATVRGACRAAFQLELMSADDFHRVCAVRGSNGTRLPAGRALSPEELKALFEACAKDRSAVGARDGAILALLYGAGLRRGEIVSLDLEDYIPDLQAVKVVGKGNKVRLAYMTEEVAKTTSAWIAFRGSGSGPLFCPVPKNSLIPIRRMTNQVVYNVIGRRWPKPELTHVLHTIYDVPLSRTCLTLVWTSGWCNSW